MVKQATQNDGRTRLSIQAGRFVVVGCSTVALDFALLGIFSSVFGMPMLLSTSLAFAIATFCNYLLSVRYVFQSGTLPPAVELGLFAGTSLIGLGINHFVMYLLAGRLLWSLAPAKIVSVGVVTVWNFAAKKTIVFLEWVR